MDKQSLELIRQSSKVYHEHVGQEYQELQEHMLGELSIAGQALSDTKEEHRQKAANLDLIRSFMSCLPRAYQPEPHEDEFVNQQIVVQTPAEAHAVSQSVLWYPWDDKYFNSKKYFVPFYIVGAYKDGNTGSTEIVAASDSSRGKLLVINSKNKKMNEIATIQDLQPAEEIASGCKNLYDPETDLLHIGYNSPISSSVKIPHARSVLPLTKIAEVFSKNPVDLLLRKNEVRYIDGVTDFEWGVFDVTSRLNRLAKIFGKYTELQGVYEQGPKPIS